MQAILFLYTNCGDVEKQVLTLMAVVLFNEKQVLTLMAVVLFNEKPVLTLMTVVLFNEKTGTYINGSCALQ